LHEVRIVLKGYIPKDQSSYQTAWAFCTHVQCRGPNTAA